MRSAGAEPFMVFELLYSQSRGVDEKSSAAAASGSKTMRCRDGP